jgi:hypothetical protein
MASIVAILATPISINIRRFAFIVFSSIPIALPWRFFHVADF